jgi:hypothetical protein
MISQQQRQAAKLSSPAAFYAFVSLLDLGQMAGCTQQQFKCHAPCISCLAALTPPPAQAAGITIPAGATWTIFAPTNDAFNDDDVREATGLTAAQLLKPANRQALAQVGHKLC